MPDPTAPLTITAGPSDLVLTTELIQVGSSVLDGMPGQAVTREEMRTPSQILVV